MKSRPPSPGASTANRRRRDPVDVALDLVGVGTRRAGFGVGHVLAMHGADVAGGIMVGTEALDDEAVAQPDHVAGEEAEVALARHFHEVLALDP